MKHEYTTTSAPMMRLNMTPPGRVEHRECQMAAAVCSAFVAFELGRPSDGASDE